mmetsp:Transcript_23106/g.61943  ORF Transcript_23106/g.61943 Transcript_23106/m.61943 type:complete len:203 (+) Transcript_23106:560-1168(+)
MYSCDDAPACITVMNCALRVCSSIERSDARLPSSPLPLRAIAGKRASTCVAACCTESSYLVNSVSAARSSSELFAADESTSTRVGACVFLRATVPPMAAVRLASRAFSASSASRRAFSSASSRAFSSASRSAASSASRCATSSASRRASSSASSAARCAALPAARFADASASALARSSSSCSYIPADVPMSLRSHSHSCISR